MVLGVVVLFGVRYLYENGDYVVCVEVVFLRGGDGRFNELFLE